ncbi:hypothetical protein COI_0180 [Mannheimia haemolytica serotype A2 str. OVINE]|nr:hypothetical protein COI_0180 [Mannheimia haemolytica serotype A2 str. OVINE]EEY11554.1 hypothetical protein COK_2388 [Mannheimia haemolytica serotype A2 str. BOVINE]
MLMVSQVQAQILLLKMANKVLMALVKMAYQVITAKLVSFTKMAIKKSKLLT